MKIITRRAFLKSSVAAGIAASGLVIFGCGSGSSAEAPDNEIPEGAVLIPHATHFGAFNAVVLDGVLIGVQPLDDIDAMPTEMLLEGILGRLYDDTRVKYPMVRKSYLENLGGDTKPELRGREPFVRVTWDEALSIVADAITETKDTYGNEALFSQAGWSHTGLYSFNPSQLLNRFFNLIGGITTMTGDYSTGASQISLPHIMGSMEVYSAQTAWEVLLENTEVMVLVGADLLKNNRIEYSIPDHQMHPNWKKIKENGTRFISINPQYTTTDEELESEWVKIIPNTDTALFLAMSYHVYINGLHDQAYLDKYTVGFDKFLPYLLGEDGDATPKTPQWASGITGIPEADIIELAELCAESRTQFAGGWAVQRADHGEMTHWAIINFAAMLGKIGKPGEGVGFSWHYGSGGMPQSGKRTPLFSTYLLPGRNPVETRCPASRITEMLLNPGKTYVRNGAESLYPNVKLIYNAGGNFMSHQQNTNELISALNQQVDTFVCQDPWWCATARFADIVLPATTTLERDDIGVGGSYSNDKIYAMRQVIEPLEESLDDFEIFRRLSEKFGVESDYTGGKERIDIIKDAYATSDATIPFDEFWEKGILTLETPEEARAWVRHSDFYQNPDENPLYTVSGKIELYCETIAGYDAEGCPPMPKWQEPAEYLGNAGAGQVHVVSPHPRMRLHSQMANSSVREHENVQGRQHLLLNIEDAQAAGIADGDLVELFNERGAVIAGARVTDKIRQGVVSLEEGQWIQLDSQGRCNSGSINMITTSKACSELSQATSANTCLASFKKCTDAESENRAFLPPEIEAKSESSASSSSASSVSSSSLSSVVSSSASSSSAAYSEPGERIFYERCTQCHVPPEPKDLTIREWRGNVEDMAEYAWLTDEEKELLLEFLEKNARDAE